MSTETVLAALRHSKLSEDLSDDEVSVLASLATVRDYRVEDVPVEMDGEALADCLLILVAGEIEVSAQVNNEPVFLHLDAPGDLARVMSFVGGRASIKAAINVKRPSTVLLLKRSSLEATLPSLSGKACTHPTLAYFVMRNLVRYMHQVSRRSSAEKEEMSNYLYSLHGRY
ncbi:MAG: hypothetical protein RL358_199 [Pseudomonadota bacterium]|jgi:hypothetical protein